MNIKFQGDGGATSRARYVDKKIKNPILCEKKLRWKKIDLKITTKYKQWTKEYRKKCEIKSEHALKVSLVRMRQQWRRRRRWRRPRCQKKAVKCKKKSYKLLRCQVRFTKNEKNVENIRLHKDIFFCWVVNVWVEFSVLCIERSIFCAKINALVSSMQTTNFPHIHWYSVWQHEQQIFNVKQTKRTTISWSARKRRQQRATTILGTYRGILIA